MRPHQDLVREVVHGQEVVVEVLLPILPSGKIRVGHDRDQNQNLDQNLEADRNLGLDLDHKLNKGLYDFTEPALGLQQIIFKKKMKNYNGHFNFPKIFFSNMCFCVS